MKLFRKLLLIPILAVILRSAAIMSDTRSNMIVYGDYDEDDNFSQILYIHEGTGINYSIKRTKHSAAFQDIYLDQVTEESCKRHFYNMQRSWCNPKKALVNVTFKLNSYNVTRVVIAKRCFGRCNDVYQCIPVEKTLSKKRVRLQIPYPNSINEMCVSVDVPEHNSCECRCKPSKDCGPNEIFNKHTCSCECDQRNTKCCGHFHLWNCTCTHKVCTTGSVLNKDTCKCVIRHPWT